MGEIVNFDEEAHDAGYFKLLYELLEKNSSRYMKQTIEILDKGSLSVEIDDAVISFKLTPVGCTSSTVDKTCTQTSGSWHRMGWKKSAKRNALPQFFASAEASLLINIS